jgi:hypothetical protein
MTQRERDGRGTQKWKTTREAVLRAAGGVCYLCGTNDPPADTVDHLLELSKGGASDLENLRAAHGRKIPGLCPGNFGRSGRKTPAPTPDHTSRNW